MSLLAAPTAWAASPVKFKVTVDASRTTSWSVDRTDSCGTVAGSGTELDTIATAGRGVVGVPGLLKPMQSSPLAISVRSTRMGALNETFTGKCYFHAGACYASDLARTFSAFPFGADLPCDQSHVADASGCGTRTTTVRSGDGLYLGYAEDGRLVIQLAIEEPFWKACPGLGRKPMGVTALGGYDFTDVPLAQLLRRRVTVLHGTLDGLRCGSASCPTPPYSLTTRASWSVRFERVG